MKRRQDSGYARRALKRIFGCAGRWASFSACRDVARRVGIVPFTPSPGDPYDPKVHHLEPPDAKPAPDAKVDLALAPGYSFQGQFLRPALVRLSSPTPGAPAAIVAPVEDAAPAASAVAPSEYPPLS